MPTSSERWMEIAGWEGLYEVSNQGRVRSLPRTQTDSLGRTRYRESVILVGSVANNGYRRVLLRDRDRRGYMSVHRLVAEHFVAGRAQGLHVCHNDGNQLNNNACNLRWDTPKANVADIRRHGRHPKLNKTHCPQGHPYSGKNLVHTKQGHRSCRSCNYARDSKAVRVRHENFLSVANDYFEGRCA